MYSTAVYYRIFVHLIFLAAGLRAHYLPSMYALRLEMYQLSRLLYDAHHDLHRHLKRNVLVVLLAEQPPENTRTG